MNFTVTKSLSAYNYAFIFSIVAQLRLNSVLKNVLIMATLRQALVKSALTLLRLLIRRAIKAMKDKARAIWAKHWIRDALW